MECEVMGLGVKVLRGRRKNQTANGQVILILTQRRKRATRTGQ